MKLTLRPISFRNACAFIRRHHRHLPPPQGSKFALAAYVGDKLVAVATAGRPVARMDDDGVTAEITRLASDGYRNSCSFLYASVRRVCQAMGYVRIITKTLECEPGDSLRADGWTDNGLSDGGEWTRPSRGRKPVQQAGRKRKWSQQLVGGKS